MRRADSASTGLPPVQGVRLSVKRSLFAELRRRNVLRTGAFYIAATWALAQAMAIMAAAITRTIAQAIFSNVPGVPLRRRAVIHAVATK